MSSIQVTSEVGTLNQIYLAERSCDTAYYAVQGGSNF